MKYLIPITVLSIIIVSTLIFINFKKNEMYTIENLWEELLICENAAQERLQISKITSWIFDKKDGSIEVLVQDVSGNLIDSNDFDFTSQKIKSITIVFYWSDDKNFKGENWVPKDKKSISLLFQE